MQPRLHRFQLAGRKFSTPELTRWRALIFDIYRRMRSMSSSYTLQCDDISITVLPNVYAPRFFTDSLWFAKEVPQVVQRHSVLEIGCGTGIVALFCARKGARVVATDINPDAVINARINAADYCLNIDVREGSVYAPIAPGERFDFIFWAHPFNNWPIPVTDMLLRSGMDYGYNDLRAYIAGARDHLTASGRLLLGSGDCADLAAITAIATQNDYSTRLVKHADMPLEEGGDVTIRYMLLELVDLARYPVTSAAKAGNSAQVRIGRHNAA